MKHIPAQWDAWLVKVALAVASATLAGAADFNLAATIRAGRPGNSAWELGIGPSINNTPVHGQVNNPYYFPNGTPNRFEIGYTSATNTAFLRYYYNGTNFRQVVYSQSGPGLGAWSVWTIPTASLFVQATNRPVRTTVTISDLALNAGVQVIQPLSVTPLTATQLQSNSLVSSTAPVQFRTNASGNWLLSGNISFSGLRAYVANGAVGAQLRMGAGINGTSSDVPEPHTAGLAMTGVALIGALAMRRQRRSAGA